MKSCPLVVKFITEKQEKYREDFKVSIRPAYKATCQG